MTSTDEKNSKAKNEQGEKRPQVKRPMNAFMLWSKEKRRKISSVDPSLHNSHISKILGEEWKTLPLNEKDPYIKESKTLMEKHKVEHPNYHYKPRQNKLTKALKELSSLHTPLSSPAGSTSAIKSLSVSRYMHEKSCYAPYRGLEGRREAYEGEREHSNISHYTMPVMYSAPQSCYGCTCRIQRLENVGYRSRNPYWSRSQFGCKEMLPCRPEKPTLFDESWNLPLVSTTKSLHHMQAPSCGWSVPVLVNLDSKELRKDTRSTAGPKSSTNYDAHGRHAQAAENEAEEKACLQYRKE